MNPNHQQIIATIAAEVKGRLANAEAGHDWWHIVRVWNMAKRIGQEEKADLFVVELAALLHDIADWKFHDGDETVGPRMAREILEKYSVESPIIDHISEIISTISFKGAGVVTSMTTLEGKVVQDADRLDAMGAIGIARTFAYGGHKKRPLYDPDHKPEAHQSKEAYFNNNASSINHFYEKLLLLKDRMNTDTGKHLALGRHQFIEQYLEQFLVEWNGER